MVHTKKHIHPPSLPSLLLSSSEEEEEEDNDVLDQQTMAIGWAQRAEWEHPLYIIRGKNPFFIYNQGRIMYKRGKPEEGGKQSISIIKVGLYSDPNYI
jgi:hypothetical protein